MAVQEHGSDYSFRVATVDFASQHGVLEGLLSMGSEYDGLLLGCLLIASLEYLYGSKSWSINTLNESHLLYHCFCAH
jgi:hypothetical protein